MTGKPLAAHLRRGQDTRRRVLASTVGIARSEGLEALTIGRVSDMNSLTKAGLLGHFPSKLDLQLSTIDRGGDEFKASVIVPARDRAPGAERLGALLRRWTDYTANLEGGCMFASISAEYDARPGVIRDRIARDLGGWISLLEREVATGLARGEFRAGTDPAATAFDFQGIQLAMNLRRQLSDDPGAQELAAGSIRAIIASRATRKGKVAFDRGWEATA